MKKSLTILFLAMIALAFTACAQVRAEYAITEDNKVLVNYTMQVDKTGADGSGYLDNGIDKILKYWEKQGMTAAKEQDDNSVTLKGAREIQAKNPKEAYEELKKILTGEYSPFTALDFRFAESYFDNKYYLAGSIDLKDIVRKEEGQTIPEDMLAKLKDAVSASDLTVTVTLPGGIVDSNGDSRAEDAVPGSGTWNIKYGGTKELKLQTLYKNQANLENYNELTKSQNTYDLVFTICIGAGAVVLIAILLVLLLSGRKKASRKTSFGV